MGSRSVSVRVPGDETHAVATGVTQSRGKPRPSDRSARPVAALIPRDPKGYRGPKMAITRLALPRAVLVLKSAFVLMTDPISPTLDSLMQRNFLNNYSMVDDYRSKSRKLDPGSPQARSATGAYHGVGVPSQ